MATLFPPRPIGAFFVLLVCVPGLIWLTQRSQTKTETFLTGWAFGAGYFIFGLYWVSFALFVDIQQFWWVLPVVSHSQWLRLWWHLYYALVPLLAWRYRKNAAAYALMFVAAWALIEWVRGHALTGFPWNLPGYTWKNFLPLMQANAVLGIYGMTLLTLLWAALPALGKQLVPFVLLSFLLVAGMGTVRLSLHPTVQSGSNTVRIVQPNIAQSHRSGAGAICGAIYMHTLGLSSIPTKLKQPITFVVWPETSLMAEPAARRPIIALGFSTANLPKGSTARAGLLRITDKDQAYNSVTVVDGKGKVLGQLQQTSSGSVRRIYSRSGNISDLTPIGNRVADIIGDFTRGPGVTTLHVGDGLPKPSPLICYEAIFPGEVAPPEG